MQYASTTCTHFFRTILESCKIQDNDVSEVPMENSQKYPSETFSVGTKRIESKAEHVWKSDKNMICGLCQCGRTTFLKTKK